MKTLFKNEYVQLTAFLAFTFVFFTVGIYFGLR